MTNLANYLKVDCHITTKFSIDVVLYEIYFVKFDLKQTGDIDSKHNNT